MTVATYTETPVLSPSKSELKEISATQRNAVLTRIRAANLPNGYNFLITTNDVFFISPSKVRLHSKNTYDLDGWIDWYELCETVAENHNLNQN